MKETPKPTELECGHTLWFVTLPDTIDETLFCARCGSYQEIAPAASKVRGVWVVHPHLDFRSKRLNLREFIGECLKEECHETITCKSWFVLRDKMHAHYMRKHTRFNYEIQLADRLPKNSPPPF